MDDPSLTHLGIQRWNGTAWAMVDADQSAIVVGASSYLLDVEPISANDVWVSGLTRTKGNPEDGLLQHWNGNQWTTHLQRGIGMHAVWAASSSDVWAAGDDGTLLHWDGRAWTGAPSGVTVALLKLWGTSSTDIWAVGIRGTILHYSP